MCEPGQVRAALARAVGDPTLEVGLWLPDRQAWVDEQGEPLRLPPGEGRHATYIGERLAVVVHELDLVDQPALLEAAGSAARLALENARLQAELRAQLVELRESRARIVRAGDDERRRLERDLHDGAQQRLLALGMGLQLLHAHVDPAARELLADSENELHHALRELRELAHGIHPAALTDNGLADAVRTLAQRAPVPITIEIDEQAGRLPQHVETAAYFVVAEALANIAKYADAHQASITVARNNGNAHIEIRDNGKGGANPDHGTGLKGLADRVGALDGHTHHPQPTPTRHPHHRRNPMRLVIADDTALVRDGLARLLQDEGFEVCGRAADATELLALVEQTTPEAAITDIRMPPTQTDEGLVAATEIRARFPETGVLVLSQYIEVGYALRLIEGQDGHCGYLLKERVTNASQIVDALHRVAAGEVVVDPALVDALLARRRVRDPLDELSDREREVLALMAEGLTDRGIAERLWLSTATVETHVRHILRKLSLSPSAGANRRVQAVLTYLRA